MADAVLIYDGRRDLFRTLADGVAGHTDGLTTVPWESEPVQRFLDAQFDDRPFAFLLVDDDDVHVGDRAVGEVLRDRGLAGPLVDALEEGYPAIAGPFGRFVHGQEPADLHGSFPLTDEARTHIDRLRQERSIPVDDDAQ